MKRFCLLLLLFGPGFGLDPGEPLCGHDIEMELTTTTTDGTHGIDTQTTIISTAPQEFECAYDIEIESTTATTNNPHHMDTELTTVSTERNSRTNTASDGTGPSSETGRALIKTSSATATLIPTSTIPTSIPSPKTKTTLETTVKTVQTTATTTPTTVSAAHTVQSTVKPISSVGSSSTQIDISQSTVKPTSTLQSTTKPASKIESTSKSGSTVRSSVEPGSTPTTTTVKPGSTVKSTEKPGRTHQSSYAPRNPVSSSDLSHTTAAAEEKSPRTSQKPATFSSSSGFSRMVSGTTEENETTTTPPPTQKTASNEHSETTGTTKTTSTSTSAVTTSTETKTPESKSMRTTSGIQIEPKTDREFIGTDVPTKSSITSSPTNRSPSSSRTSPSTIRKTTTVSSRSGHGTSTPATLVTTQSKIPIMPTNSATNPNVTDPVKRSTTTAANTDTTANPRDASHTTTIVEQADSTTERDLDDSTTKRNTMVASNTKPSSTSPLIVSSTEIPKTTNGKASIATGTHRKTLSTASPEKSTTRKPLHTNSAEVIRTTTDVTEAETVMSNTATVNRHTELSPTGPSAALTTIDGTRSTADPIKATGFSPESLSTTASQSSPHVSNRNTVATTGITTEKQQKESTEQILNTIGGITTVADVPTLTTKKIHVTSTTTHRKTPSTSTEHTMSDHEIPGRTLNPEKIEHSGATTRTTISQTTTEHTTEIEETSARERAEPTATSSTTTETVRKTTRGNRVTTTESTTAQGSVTTPPMEESIELNGRSSSSSSTAAETYKVPTKGVATQNDEQSTRGSMEATRTGNELVTPTSTDAKSNEISDATPFATRKTAPVKKTTSGTIDSSDTTAATLTITKVDGSTTENNIPPHVHYTDMGSDEIFTPVPDYCQNACPYGFVEGVNGCFFLAHPDKSMTYTSAISHCQTLSSPRSNLASEHDFRNLDNLALFKEMISTRQRRNDHCFVNAHASKNFRKARKADIVSLRLVNQIDLHVVDTVGTGERIEDVNSICKTTKFCKPNKCLFEEFYDYDKNLVVGLPTDRDGLNAGEKITVPCIQYPTDQVHTVVCQPNGEFAVHPSLITCKKPEKFVEEEVDMPQNPLQPLSCEDCYEVGTDACVKNPEGPGIKCICKKDWTKRTCWHSPSLCKEDSCGPSGTCISYVDRIACICEEGMIGDRCTMNATQISWFGTNTTLAVVNARTIGVFGQASSSMLILAVKFFTKNVKTGHSEDPQQTFQTYRLALVSVGNAMAFIWTHPDMLKVDEVSCRFYFWAISFCFTAASMFYLNESINVFQLFRALHRNSWNTDFDGNPRKDLKFRNRVIIPFAGVFFAVLAVLVNGWDKVTTRWTCTGSFHKSSADAWAPLLVINIAFTGFTIAFTEGSNYLKKYRPHARVRLHRWFDVNKPGEFERILKVERNVNLVSLGAFLHLMTWISLIIAADKNTPLQDSISLAFSHIYMVFGFVQLVITDPFLYGWASVVAMVVLPKSWAPDFEWNKKRNRDEVLAQYFKRRYFMEQRNKVREDDKRQNTERETIEKKNSELQEKYPGIPQGLLYHVPLEPPPITIPRPYPFDQTDDDYMPEWERKQLTRIWTRSYLETRRFHKGTPVATAMEVLKVEIRRGIFQASKRRREQELFTLAQWWQSVPGMDRTVLRAHKKTVVMEDENETDVLAFERAVMRLASIIDLRINRQRKALLEDHSTDAFRDMAKFLSYVPPGVIRCVEFETMKSDGDVEPKEFLKQPDIVLESQGKEWDVEYAKGVAKLNIPFDKTFDDDHSFVQYNGTFYEEAAKEILKVQPAQIGEQPISMNPRFRPLDSFWMDSQRPDFIGPRTKHDIPVGSYEEYTRKCEYYQTLMDAFWAQLEHNAYHRHNLERIRRGEL